MNCEQIQINLLDYANGRLSQPECDKVREHLNECAECAVLLKEEVAFSRRLDSLDCVQPENDVWALVRAKTKPSRWHMLTALGSFMRGGYRLMAAAAVALLLFAAVFSFTLTNNQQKSPEMSAQVKSSVTQVKWSDDPMGNQTDATIEYINNM